HPRPISITDDRHGIACGREAVVGRECASQQRFDAKRLEIILSDESAAGGLRAASGCDPQVAEVRASKEGGKYPVVVSKFAIKGIGEYIRPRRSRDPVVNAGGLAHGYKPPRELRA